MATPKIKIPDLQSILASSNLSQDVVDSILTRAASVAAAGANTRAGGERAPTGDKRNIIILTGPQEILNQVDTEVLTGFAIQISAEDDHNQIIPRLVSLSQSYNASRRRRQGRIETLGDAMDTLKPKRDFDGFPLKALIKEPALILLTENIRIPETAPAETGGGEE